MECYPSKLKLLGLLGLTCVMVSVSYFCTTEPSPIDRVVGWIGVGFFGLGFVAFPVMFFRAGPQVVINDEGIEDRRWKIGAIRWEDIRSLSIGSVNSAKFLSIEVADPEKYLCRLPRWRRWMGAANKALGFPALTIGFSDLSPGLKEVWAYLKPHDGIRRGGDAALARSSRVSVRESVKSLSTAFLKIAALFSFCGGPLLVSDQLKHRFGTHIAFPVTIAPVLVMLFGAQFLEDDVEDRIARAAVWWGRQGLYVALAMHAYAIWWFANGRHVSEQWLYYTGIVIGLIWSTVYLRAGRRWVVARNRSAGKPTERDASPIEPS
jgi:hypothetical protein